ncbi:sodium channel subunit beta-4-like isoform X1 [Pseudorasbora parva]|uniref:sodium channel subunit beta-4-like isoform X1 n=1 Tax=Pseudorasbora parva TaxID=51549 RepID=UPI00351E94C6
MIISCCFICVFAVLINKVSLQVSVEAVIGGSVVLPCSSTDHDLKLQDIRVFWRHNGSKIVSNIIPSSHSLENQNQDPEYKNRTETFPEEHERGNFSIKLKDLTHTDAGKYICYITHSYEHQTVQLILNESASEKGTMSTEQENQGGTEPDSVGTSSTLIWVGILLTLCILFIFICLLVRFIVKKKTFLSSYSAGTHNMDLDNHEDES